MKIFFQTIVEQMKEYFHWFMAVAPLTASIVASFLGNDEHVIHLILIGAAIGFNVIVLTLRSVFEKDDDLTLLSTFMTNNLPPNKGGRELLFKTKVSVVNLDSDEEAFFRSLDKKFHSEAGDENTERIFKKHDGELAIVPISCELLSDETLTERERDLAYRELKDKLKNSLHDSKAVVVIRTEELENNPWVYEAIDEWAYQHSDVPILFVKQTGRKYRPNKYADKYFWIPDDPKTLPWRLLQRANERTSAWFEQAKYNKAIATNFLFLLLMLSYFAWFIVIVPQKKQQQFVAQGMYDVMNAKYQLITEYLLPEKPENIQRIKKISEVGGIEVSYWIRYENNPYVFVTTEDKTHTNHFNNNENSIIGCGFKNNSDLVVQWIRNDINPNDMHADAWNAHDWQINIDCNMTDLDNSPIKSIFCATHKELDGTNLSPIVGVCVFTKDETLKNDIFVKDYRAFVRKKAGDFYTSIQPQIKRNELVPLDKRPKDSCLHC